MLGSLWDPAGRDLQEICRLDLATALMYGPGLLTENLGFEQLNFSIFKPALI